MIRISPVPRPSGGQCRGESQGPDLENARLEQGIRGRVQRMARRQHVIDEPHLSCRSEAVGDAKGASHVFASRTPAQARLFTRILNPLEGVRCPDLSKTPGNSARDRIGLIETSRTTPTGVKRNAHNQIRPALSLLRDTTAQLTREVIDRESNRDGWTEWAAGILEAGNPSPRGLVVAKQCAAAMERAAVHEASRTSVERGSRAALFVAMPDSGTGPTARTTIDDSPPGHSPMACGAKRRWPRPPQGVAFDATGLCERVQ